MLTLTSIDQEHDGSTIDVAIVYTDMDNLVDTADLTEELWQPYADTIPVLSAAAYQVWFRDAAGNISEPITIEGDSSDENDAGSRLYLPLITR